MYVIVKSQMERKLDWMPNHGFEKDMHGQAAKLGKGFGEFMEDIKTQEMSEESPYVGMSQIEVAKARIKDPTGTPLTALEEAMWAAGIDLKRDTVGKFFDYAATTVLFPEYFKNQVAVGLLKRGLVESLVMSSSVIPSVDYHKLYLDDTEGERQLSKVGPSGPYARTKMSVSKQSMHLQKYARMLEVDDDTLLYQRLPVFARCLNQIGLQLDIDRTNDCLYNLVNGDGNSNTPGKTMSGAANSVAVLIEFYTKLAVPYRINKMILHKAELITYLTTLTGFSNPQAQFSFLPLVTPEWMEWDDTSGLAANRVLGLDTGFAVEEVTTGGVVTESDRLIDGGINQTAIVWRGAYSVWDNAAVCLWTVT